MEVILTLALLGVLVGPLMNLLVVSQRISSQSEKEYNYIQTAQYYMEEIKAMNEIDRSVFDYNSGEMCYERFVTSGIDDLSVEIRIRPADYGLHYIEVDILRDGEIVSSLMGSVVFK